MLDVRGLTIQSGAFQLQPADITVPAGSYCVVMGQTGSGKTTLLEGICGLRRVAAGTVLLDGIDITRASLAARGIGYVPQDLALFPTLSVRQHLAFALRLRRIPAAEIRARVEALAESLEIGPLLERGVQQLSGGEARRVALGRAVSFRPRLLLLDEPLSTVDEATRDRLCNVLHRIQRDHQVPTVHVTHSRDEARRLADMLYVVERGTVAARPLTSLQTDGPAVQGDD